MPYPQKKIPWETGRILGHLEDLISAWLAEGLLERWTPRLQELEGYSSVADGPATFGTRMSFFDVLTAQELYVSPGGMRNLCVTWVWKDWLWVKREQKSGGIWYLDMFCFQQINTHTQHLGGMWKDEICGELYRILRLWERDSGGKHQSDAQYIAKCSSLAYGEHHALCHLVCRTYACVTRGIFGFETSTDAVYFLEYSRIWHVIFVGVWVVC